MQQKHPSEMTDDEFISWLDEMFARIQAGIDREYAELEANKEE